jgi:hypothetical protein
MIDPSDVTKFDRTDDELETWWLFSTIVAGKTAATQAKFLDQFLTNAGVEGSPFDIIRTLLGRPSEGCYSPLEEHMRAAHLGQYSRLTRCWEESLALDLRNDPVEAFEAIHGVGPKTARMFIMHSRPDQRLAALDTHILKLLKTNGFDVPKTTPSGKQYQFLEDAFLALADAAGETPADFDLKIWKSYAR